MGLVVRAFETVVVTFSNIPSNVKSAPTEQLIAFATAFTLGVLGIVPGVLNMYGCNHASDIVSVVAGAFACFVGLITLCFKYNIGGGNQ